MNDGSDNRVTALLQKLADRGCRITPQRLRIVEALVGRDDHPNAEQVFARVRETCPNTSLATIYKTIDLLKAMGEVLELEFSDGSNRYDGRRPSAHPHAICTRCGRIQDLEVAGLTDIQDQAARASGFRIVTHRMDFYGLCQQCQQA